jgi:hypothetical protein
MVPWARVAAASCAAQLHNAFRVASSWVVPAPRPVVVAVRDAGPLSVKLL